MAEIGPGRGQNQYLASLFHQDAPNDVAPIAYNGADLPPGLPSSRSTPRDQRSDSGGNTNESDGPTAKKLPVTRADSLTR